MALANLNELAENVKREYSGYRYRELKLPHAFKDRYSVVENHVQWLEHTARIKTVGGLTIDCPNQWFIMARYVVEYLSELTRYKQEFQSIADTLKWQPARRKDVILEIKNNPAIIPAELQNAIDRHFNRDQLSKEYLIIFLTNYSWWYGSKTIDRGDYYVSPVLALLGVVHVAQSYIAEIAWKLATVTGLPETLDMPEEGAQTMAVNQIVYGAPGTGKSYYLESRYGGTNMTRVTFHPDYTYHDFIGSYKPVPLYEDHPGLRTINGKEFGNGKPVIDYQFVPGPFARVLIDALRNPDEIYTLLIEEMNRANAPSVFGDVFQLLDRDENGESEYEIFPDPELLKYLCSETDKDIGKLRIPGNMNIVATMNSADQGVFVLDSAFKRRWKFMYLAIDLNNMGHGNVMIDYAGGSVTWRNLVKGINEKLSELNINEDKHIGPFFIKPSEITDQENIKSKLLIYLWDDVVRHQRRNFFETGITIFSNLVQKFESGERIFNFDLQMVENELGVANDGDGRPIFTYQEKAELVPAVAEGLQEVDDLEHD